MEEQKCFMPICDKKYEFSDSYTSLETFCPNMDKIEPGINEISDLRLKNKAILDFFQKEMLERNKLKIKIGNSIYELCMNARKIMKEFLSDFDEKFKIPSNLYEQTFINDKTSAFEKDLFPELASLPLEKAIENIKMMLNLSESNIYANKFFELAESMNNQFQEKWLNIKNSLNTFDIESFELFKKATCHDYIVKGTEMDFASFPKKINYKDTLSYFQKPKIQEVYLKASGKISAMDKLLIDYKNPDNSLYCIQAWGLRLEIMKGKIRETGEEIAVKTITSDDLLDIENYMNEVKFYENLSNKDSDIIMKYYGHFNIERRKKMESKYQYYIVIEPYKTCLLYELYELENQKQHYENHVLAQKIYSLLDLFKKLSKENIVYCNIEPRNIFIVNGEKFKLGDFYLAKSAEADDLSSPDAIFYNFEKTKNYMAPELRILYDKKFSNMVNLNEKRQFSTEKSDVFSLGLIFLDMILLKSFNNLNDSQYRNLLDDIIENLELGWTKTLLQRMLASNCQERPTFEEALDILDKNSEFNSCFNSSN